MMNLVKFLVWEVPELGATTRKADREALKDFISKEWTIFRQPYAITNTKKPALSSFIGTINSENGFLNDPSGTRRFNVITINSIDWNYSKEIDINNIWCEAYQLYKSDNFNYRLTPDEGKAHDTLNGEYTYKTFVDEILDAYISITGEADDFISTLGLVRALKALDCKGLDDAISKKVKSWMQQKGIEKPKQKSINGKKLRGFAGVKENFPDKMLSE
jgi:predicted P-loop ATPase